MKIKLNEKEYDVKVGFRSLSMLEKETGLSLSDIFTETGRLPHVRVVASMIKQATTLKEEECYQALDESPSVFAGIIKEYSACAARIFAIGEAGNSESLTTTS